MNNSVNSATLRLLETYRTELHAVVDTRMNDLIGKLVGENAANYLPGESRVSLYTDPATLKGTKPTAVLLGGERVSVKKWREVYIEILRRCDQQKHEELLALRNRVAGRKRRVISDKPDGMDFPIMLSEDLYIEADFDTEWLMRTLVERILDVVRFDYSGIAIMIKRKGDT